MTHDRALHRTILTIGHAIIPGSWVAASLFALAMIPSSVLGQVIGGSVVDSETGQAVPGMEVVVRAVEGGRSYRGIVDDEGTFRIAVDTSGLYTITLSRLGYSGADSSRVEVRPGEDLFLQLVVMPDAVDLESIRVEVTRRSAYLEGEGFYRRMDRGLGEFMEWREIQAYPSAFASHVLRSKGISIRDGRIRGCRLMVDGMQLDWDDLRIDDILNKNQMLALEIHTEMVPLELRGPTLLGKCVVAIWTTWGDAVVPR